MPKKPPPAKGPTTAQQVGALIRVFRRAKKMKQPELGKAIGVTFQMVQKYEKGQSALTVERLGQIADALGCTTQDLMPT